MAVLQKIRNRSVLLVSSIAIALFLFVIGDLLRGGESLLNQSKQTVGEIDGDAVSIQDYQKLVEQLTNFYEIAQQKQGGFTEEENNRIKDEAWQQMIANNVIGKECAKLGIAVTDDEVADIIKNGQSQYLQIPFFMNQQTGRYDYASVTNFLTEYKKAQEGGQQLPEIYEKLYKAYMFAQEAVRSQALMQKYQNLLVNCVLSNPIEAKMAFEARSNESDIILAAIPFTSVDDSKVKVEDADLKAKYDEDKEKFYQEEETRDVKVVTVAVTPSAEDKTATEKEFADYYTKLSTAADNNAISNIVRQSMSLVSYTDIFKTKDAFPQMLASKLDSAVVGETVKPVYDAATNVYYTYRLVEKTTQVDSVLYRQIGIQGKDAAESKAKADSIVNAINGGASFKELAKKYNQTGDSAWIASAHYQNGMIDENSMKFINTLYGMHAGETKVLTIENSSVVLQVMDTKNPVTKYNLAAVVKELKYSNETYKNEYNKLSSFLASNKTIEQIEANAPKSGYAVTPLNDIQTSSHNIAGIPGTRDALKWVFDEAKVGSVSQLYEVGTGDRQALLIVALTDINKVGYRSADKMKDYLTAQVTNDKKAEIILSEVKNVKDIASALKAKNVVSDTIKHVSFAANAAVQMTSSSEPLVSAIANKTAKGAFAGPFKGNSAVYMLQVINKTKTSEKYDQKTELQTVVQNDFRYVANNIFDVLRRKAKVVDNRYKFF